MKILSHVPIVRRDFLKIGGLGAVSCLIPTKLMPFSQAAFANEVLSGTPMDRTKTYKIVRAENGTAKIKPLVIIWLPGGLSHLDTFCPVPDMPIERRGPFKTIPTKVPGLHVSETIPEIAQIMHHTALLGNIYHTQGDHVLASNRVLTGVDDKRDDSGPKYKPFHAMLGNFLGKDGVSFVIVNPHPYITSALSPEDALVIQRHSWLPKYESPIEDNIDIERLNNRADLLDKLNRKDLETDETIRWETLIEKGREIIIGGDFNKALDLSKVDEKERERYGKNEFGEAGIMAKNLVRAGVPIVLIHFGSWDNHENIEERFKYDIPPLDKFIAATIEDLKDEAIVVVASEFGRTPIINHKKGRDHWPQSNFMLIAGPGIEPRAYGKIDVQGFIVGQRFNGAFMGPTILRAAGYELKEERNGVLSADPVPYYPIF